jgi:tRNA (adenine22-N1)-methyltransferase
LRRWLVQHGYRIADESLCKENGHIYVIIKVIHTEKKQKLSVIEEELGPCIMEKKPALWQEFIQEKSEHYRRLLRQMEVSSAAMNSDKYKDMKNMLVKVDALINKSV